MEGGEETLGHILSACPAHQWNLYKERHDRVLLQLAKAVLSHLGLPIPNDLTGKGGVAKPGVAWTGETRVLIDQEIPTDRSIKHRRPDLVVRMDK